MGKGEGRGGERGGRGRRRREAEGCPSRGERGGRQRVVSRLVDSVTIHDLEVQLGLSLDWEEVVHSDLLASVDVA